MSGSQSALLAKEAAADQQYGFPPGTLEALAQTESSNGTNLGSIGNVFQVLPSTAANPGYGLGPIDGNDPASAGGYLNALWQGPAHGDLATAFAMYQGGAGNPTPYGPNTPASQFLANLNGAGGNTAANPLDAQTNAAGNPVTASGAATGSVTTGGSSATSAQSYGGLIDRAWELISRAGLIITGLSLVLVALIAMLFRSKTVGVPAKHVFAGAMAE